MAINFHNKHAKILNIGKVRWKERSKSIST